MSVYYSKVIACTVPSIYTRQRILQKIDIKGNSYMYMYFIQVLMCNPDLIRISMMMEYVQRFTCIYMYMCEIQSQSTQVMFVCVRRFAGWLRDRRLSGHNHKTVHNWVS